MGAEAACCTFDITAGMNTFEKHCRIIDEYDAISLIIMRRFVADLEIVMLINKA